MYYIYPHTGEIITSDLMFIKRSFWNKFTVFIHLFYSLSLRSEEGILSGLGERERESARSLVNLENWISYSLSSLSWRRGP